MLFQTLHDWICVVKIDIYFAINDKTLNFYDLNYVPNYVYAFP